MRTNDGAYRNMVTGLGTAEADKAIHSEVAPSRGLTPEQVSEIYMADGIGATIASCVPDDAMSNGWEPVGDNDGKLWKELGSLGVHDLLQNAALFTSLYGGAVMVAHVEGSGALESPLVGNGRVKRFSVWSSGRAQLTQGDFVTDSASPYFDDVEVYTLRRRDGSTFRVHASRCIVFKGMAAPDCWNRATIENMHFGVSVLHTVRERLMGLGVSMQGVDSMLSEPDVGIYSLDGLNERLAEADEGMKSITERMQVMHLSKSLLRALIMDKNDTYNQVSHNFTGIPETIQKEMNMVAACAQIPVTRLFGEAASGLNATGKGDERNYNRRVAAFQSRTLSGPLSKIATMVNMRNGRFVTGERVDVVFSPLDTPTMSELVDMRLKQAQTDDLNIRNQIITPEEARRSRMVGGYSFETTVDEGA